MNQLAQFILAMLLTIITPGNSHFSRVPIPRCDATCQKTPLCSNKTDWRCKVPEFAPRLYAQKLKYYRQSGMSPVQARARAKLESFTRPETYAEGLVRYVIISRAIAATSKSNTRYICKESCNEQSRDSHKVCSQQPGDARKTCDDKADKAAISCHKSCVNTAPWLWSQSGLAIMEATVTGQESGYRGDVQGGTGKMGRGDCQWSFPDGRRAAPWTKGAYPIASTCRSVCLGQINVGHGKTPEGYTANDLVGLDYQSTERCLTVVAHVLAKSRLLCTRWHRVADWPAATFSAYGTGATCHAYRKRLARKGGKTISQYAYKVREKNGKLGISWGSFPPDNAIDKRPMAAAWPIRRSKIFQRYEGQYRSHGLNLSPRAQQLLGEPRFQKAVERLMTASHQVEWSRPLPPATPVEVSMKPSPGPIETARR